MCLKALFIIQEETKQNLDPEVNVLGVGEEKVSVRVKRSEVVSE